MDNPNVSEQMKELIRVFSEIWKCVSETVNNILNQVTEIEEKTHHDYNWHVPIDTRIPSQVNIPKIHMPNIRSQL